MKFTTRSFTSKLFLGTISILGVLLMFGCGDDSSYPVSESETPVSMERMILSWGVCESKAFDWPTGWKT
jgi:hypothetical protein